MSRTTMITTRVEPLIKTHASAVLGALGLSVSDAINMFLHQVVLQKGLPFDVKVPNKATQKAMANALSRENLKHYKSLDALKAKFD